MITRVNNRALILIELLAAIVILTFLAAIVTGIFILTTEDHYTGASEQQLQYKVNTLLAKIIEGKPEPGGIFRLSEAVTYNLVDISELHFTGTDSIERWFRLDSPSRSVIYHHPTALGIVDETIYTAPAGTVITLRFSIPAGPQYEGVVVGIDAALTCSAFGRTVSGSASTYVNIRNHSV